MGDFASKVLAEMGSDDPKEERPRGKKGSVPDEVLKSLERTGDQDPSNQLARAISEGIQEPDEEPKEPQEQRAETPVEHPGILEIPKDKSFVEMSSKHFVALAKRKGWKAIAEALTSLKAGDPAVVKKAESALDAIKKAFEKRT